MWKASSKSLLLDGILSFQSSPYFGSDKLFSLRTAPMVKKQNILRVLMSLSANDIIFLKHVTPVTHVCNVSTVNPV